MIKKDTIGQLKTKLYSVIQILHMTVESSQSIYTQIGNFRFAYKSIENHKLRPIISQVTTQTYNQPKYLKIIISPYMPREQVFASTYEFLDLTRTTEISRGIMVSLAVERLFINVKVEETIIIVHFHSNDNKNIWKCMCVIIVH